MEGRAAVASVSTGYTATTERGPPHHPQTCAQNARMFRNKELEPVAECNHAAGSSKTDLKTKPRELIFFLLVLFPIVFFFVVIPVFVFVLLIPIVIPVFFVLFVFFLVFVFDLFPVFVFEILVFL